MNALSPHVALVDDDGFLRPLDEIEADVIAYALQERSIAGAAKGLRISRGKMHRIIRASSIERTPRAPAPTPPRAKRGRKTKAAAAEAAAREFLARQGTGRARTMSACGRDFGVSRDLVSRAVAAMQRTERGRS